MEVRLQSRCGFFVLLLHGLQFPSKPTCTPKVRKMMARLAVIMGLGLLFYILLGLRKNQRLGFRVAPKLKILHDLSIV